MVSLHLIGQRCNRLWLQLSSHCPVFSMHFPGSYCTCDVPQLRYHYCYCRLSLLAYGLVLVVQTI